VFVHSCFKQVDWITRTPAECTHNQTFHEAWTDNFHKHMCTGKYNKDTVFYGLKDDSKCDPELHKL